MRTDVAMDHRSPDLTKQYFYTVIFIFAVNAMSAILFMSLVKRPVYDDGFNMYDVHAYAAKGMSISTMRAQRNAPGPTSFMWMGTAVRLLDHDELLSARIGVLFSWILLVAGLLIGARYSRWPQLWYAALLAALVFPHAMTASATALTEGPALLFAILGVFAWTEAASKQDGVTLSSLVWGCIGGFLMGMAFTCRQYYLALLPSAGVLILLMLKGRTQKQKLQVLGFAVVTLGVALLPILSVFLVWGGVTSPSMASGTSYGNYQAGVGLAWFRPVDVAFYAALYLFLFSFPAIWQVPAKFRWPALVTALLAGLAATHFREFFLNPGPLQSFVGGASRIPGGAAVGFFLVAGVTAYNTIAVGLLLWNERSKLMSNGAALFAFLMIIFFIAEQFGVGGNIPFYDRYILQLVPFLGIIGFWLFPKFTRFRVLAMVGLILLSQGMLWRHALER